MEQKHILMVDDVTTSLKCAGEVLKDTYRLSMAKSGKQALQLLERTKPDLILMDINMPDMNGYETMKRIKAVPEYADIPVVFLTADSETESEIEGFNLGAMDFIRKPFEPDVMRKRIAKILQVEDTKKKLEITASRDALTGLWNRKYLETQTNILGAEGTQGAFLLFDMDNFKGINDHYGHIMGDEVLINFSNTLTSSTKKTDIVARLGGDEFALFLKGKMTQEHLQENIEALLKEIEKNVSIMEGCTDFTSVSIGVAMMPQDGTDFMTLYNKADKALYYVKQNGKKGFHFYQDKGEYSLVTGDAVNVDLMRLREMFSEQTGKRGAYDVEYEGFKRIYQFVERCVERSNREVQIVLFTVDDSNGNQEQMTEMLSQLSEAIVGTLRKGDVATRYSNTQYIVILMDTTMENGKIAAERVAAKCREIVEQSGLKLSYDMQTVQKTKE